MIEERRKEIMKPIYDHMIRSGYRLYMDDYGVVSSHITMESTNKKRVAMYLSRGSIHFVDDGRETTMELTNPGLIPAIEEHFKRDKKNENAKTCPLRQGPTEGH